MIGTIAAYTSGHPWPGGGSVSFERTAVRAVGQLRAYNDCVKRYLVRLADGCVVFVKLNEQAVEADYKWIREFARVIVRELRQKAIEGTLAVPSRDVGSVVHWKDADVGAVLEQCGRIVTVPKTPAQLDREITSALAKPSIEKRTGQLRKAFKAIDPEIRVSSRRGGWGGWVIRTNYHLDAVRALIKQLGLVEESSDIEGNQWDWTHVIEVADPPASEPSAK